MTKGIFIVIEGINGAGKSTLIQNLKMGRLGVNEIFVYTKEPYKLNLIPVSTTVEAFSYAADRFNHIEEVIQPALDKGRIVICDRYIDSSIVYQGKFGNFSTTSIMALHEISNINCPKPDLTIFVNAKPCDAIYRQKGTNYSLSQLCKLSDAYYECYKDRNDVYFTGNKNSPTKIADDVHREIRKLLDKLNIERLQVGSTSSNSGVTLSVDMSKTDNDIKALQQSQNAMSSNIVCLENQFMVRFQELRKLISEVHIKREISDLEERLDDLEERIDDLE